MTTTKPTSSLVRVLQIGLLISLLLSAGVLIYALFIMAPDLPKLTKRAEEAQQKGEEAYESNNFAAATARFDTVLELTDTVRQQADSQLQENPSNPDQLKELLGRVQWLKFLALRDRAYSRQAERGEPIKTIEDSLSREPFRSIMFIPSGLERADAMQALRAAASLLPANAEILRETLRTEAMQGEPDQWHWATIRQAATAMLKLEPGDIRAHYMLALYEFEQPVDDVSPMRWESRSKDRIHKARIDTVELKQLCKEPLWRVLYLELQTYDWMIRSKNGDLTLEEWKWENTEFRRLLFDPRTGALARAKREEGFEILSQRDTAGLIGAYNLALMILQAEAANPEAAEGVRREKREKLLEVLSEALQTLTKVVNRPPENAKDCLAKAEDWLEIALNFYPDDPLEPLEPPESWLDLSHMINPYLRPPTWNIVVERAERLLAAARTAESMSPELVHRMERFLRKEKSHVEGQVP